MGGLGDCVDTRICLFCNIDFLMPKMLDYGTHPPTSVLYCGALKPTHYVLRNDQAVPIMLGNVLV